MTKEGRKESKLKQYMIAPFRILNKARQLYMKGVVECAGGYGGYAGNNNGGALSPALVHAIPEETRVVVHRKQRREKKMMSCYNNDDEQEAIIYVGVGDMESVQLFYWFVESERNPEEDPLLLWLTGGPGCSGFSGLVFEVGPLMFDYAKSRGSGTLPTLKLNPFSWTKVASMIFIDAPVGTGFSYATNPESYGVTDTLAAAHNYQFLRKWLLSNPKFQKNPLYIAGDSYSGIILPILVKTISDGNESEGGGRRMNLKGYILGNPVTDLSVDKNWRIPFYHKLALISDQLYQATKTNCKGQYINVDSSNAACFQNLQLVSECVRNIFKAQILEPNCFDAATKEAKAFGWDPSNLTHHNQLNLLFPNAFHHTPTWCRPYNYVFSYIWANDGEVQTALHVRKGIKMEWNRCNRSLSYTYDVTSTVPYHKYLINKDYKVLIYSGDHDAVIPYLGTMTWIKSLNLSFKRDWLPWYVGGQVGGYTLQYTQGNYNLVYATVKGGGHTAPEYRPEESLAMISRWLAGFPI
ncbi:serine carboxypeptidase-like 18 isoform X1 [Arachis stenosperma]|uniref:serine carboxypeptidase-like 18 isoform X1 n=1 Tax=Arachis stenosperma TaxID=217475 RepID=UPI0025ACA8A7|nr:serine carboxypeptidase-like 18 isoform X1 [Arachis stenosperma]